mmetsp:Transcript_13579/g.28472  ORF Transcript_13579/g.28472 Transcript_13579/m.28472 type:complete len:266 (-) Transcript_13579:98-895(-)
MVHHPLTGCCRGRISKVHQIIGNGSSGGSGPSSRLGSGSLSCCRGSSVGGIAGTGWLCSSGTGFLRCATGPGLTPDGWRMLSSVLVVEIIVNLHQVQHFHNHYGGRCPLSVHTSLVSNGTGHRLSHHFEGALRGLGSAVCATATAATQFRWEQEFSQLVLRCYFHWKFCIAVLDIPPTKSSFLTRYDLVFHHNSPVITLWSKPTQRMGSDTMMLDRVQSRTRSIGHSKAVVRISSSIGFRIYNFVKNQNGISPISLVSVSRHGDS